MNTESVAINLNRRRPAFSYRFAARALILCGLLFSACGTPEPKVERIPDDRIIGTVNIIPHPRSVKRLGGQFLLSSETRIFAKDHSGRRLAEVLNEMFRDNYGVILPVVTNEPDRNAIHFAVDDNGTEGVRSEEYTLEIDADRVRIAGTEKGIFYGLQTLRQLLAVDNDRRVYLPSVNISDGPRFSYRGMHLDVARHFMPVDFIKRQIRLLAKYKFNFFHLHLTDDQGWRIEIKKYPKLTEVGSRRPETVVGKNYNPYVGDGIPVTGFYTQQQIREIVAFAKRHHITIIPEIDLPGHSSAALAAYPEYGCKLNYRYSVKTTWGGFPDILCPTEPTFQFLEGVLSEVIELFPDAPYLHLGGDEVVTTHWEQSAYVKELMKREKLKSQKELQNWFFSRVARFVQAKGKKVIGWDETFDHGVPTDVTIMIWRDEKLALEAVRAGHEVIMTPSKRTYFDHPQGNARSEPISLGSPVSLQDVYQFEPIPAGLKDEEQRLIIGGQGCVWTEFLKGPASVEYMTFPRAIALAEVLWSEPISRNYANFVERLQGNRRILDHQSVNYRRLKPGDMPKSKDVDKSVLGRTQSRNQTGE